MSNLTDLLPAGAGGKQVDFVASGTIGNGVTVALKADGTVSAVSSTSISQGAGSNATFESGAVTYVEVAYDTANDKFVYIYSDAGNSSYGTAVVGTVSGTSISFGSPVVFESASVRYTGVVYDSNAGKIVIVYQDQANTEKGTAIVGTVSGTSISFGSAALFNNGVTTWISAAFDSTNNKVVVAYQDESNSNQGTGIVGTVSGTSISFGSEAIFNTGTTGSNYTSTTYDSGNGKIVVAFQDKSNSSYGTAVVGTVSGTSISWGSKVVYHNAGSCDQTSIAYDSDSGKVIVACRYETNLDHGITYVGTVSGTSISFGSLTTFNSGTTNEMKLVYDPNAQLITAFYRDGSSSSYLKANTGIVSGTSVTWGTEFSLKNYIATNIGAEYDPDSKQIGVGYRNNNIANYGYAVMYQNPYTTTNYTSFIGISDAAISNAASGSVTIKGGIVANIPIGYYSLSSPSYDEKSFTPSPAINSIGVAFKTDGTKMYTLDLNGDDVAQYSLTSAWDVSTATSDSKTFDVGSQDTDPYEISFKSDGTKMYILGTANDTLYQYSLSSAWDVSTASYDSVSFSFTSQTLQPYGMDFSPDGTKLYIADYQNVRVLQYELSTAWDVSTMSYASKLLDVSTEVGGQFIYSVAVSSDGTSIFVGTHSSGNIYQYSLSSAFDVSSGSYAGVSFSTSAQEGSVTSIAFKSDGAKMYVTGFSSDTIFQYSTTTALTPNQNYYVQTDGTLSTTTSSVLAGKALSSTSINLDYTS